MSCESDEIVNRQSDEQPTKRSRNLVDPYRAVRQFERFLDINTGASGSPSGKGDRKIASIIYDLDAGTTTIERIID